MSSDSHARIPIRIGPAGSARPDSHVLVASEIAGYGARPSGHVFGCACCVPRGILARSLSRLFLARIRGEVAYFREVVLVTDQDRGALEDELKADVLVTARFYLSP